MNNQSMLMKPYLTIGSLGYFQESIFIQDGGSGPKKAIRMGR